MQEAGKIRCSRKLVQGIDIRFNVMVAVALNKWGHVTLILFNYIFNFLGLLFDGKLKSNVCA
jgi:hypothetical protein